MGIQVYMNEDKIERTSKTKSVLNHEYLECHAHGTLSAHNMTSKKVLVRIKANLYGDLTQATRPPLSSVETSANDLANAQRRLTWELGLEPGKDVSIKYQRTYYIRKK